MNIAQQFPNLIANGGPGSGPRKKLTSPPLTPSATPVKVVHQGGFEFHVTTHEEDGKYYTRVNHDRYGKRKFSTPEKAIEHTETKILPIRVQVLQAEQNRPKPSSSDQEARIYDRFFKEAKKNKFH